MLALLALLLLSSVYAQDGNGTLEQKPTEEKQGGEYSGFEESQEQNRGLPNQEANPTPQAPISGLDVQQENRTSTAATAVEPSSPYGMTLLAGIGAVAAGAIVAAAWYFRKGRSR